MERVTPEISRGGDEDDSRSAAPVDARVGGSSGCGSVLICPPTDGKKAAAQVVREGFMQERHDWRDLNEAEQGVLLARLKVFAAETQHDVNKEPVCGVAKSSAQEPRGR
eukprot:6562896-Prymnesium_polylepis.1